MKHYKLTSERRDDGLKRLVAKIDIPQFGVKKGDKGALIHPDALLSDDGNWWAHEKTTIWGGTIWGGDILGGTIWGGDIRGGTILGGTILGGTIWGGTIRGGDIRSGTIWGGLDFLTVGPIGSRGGVTTFVKDGLLVSCGCFSGTLEDFAAKVEADYPTGRFGDEYRAAIALAKRHFAVEG